MFSLGLTHPYAHLHNEGVESSRLGDDGVKTIAQTLRTNKTLRALYIGISECFDNLGRYSA